MAFASLQNKIVIQTAGKAIQTVATVVYYLSEQLPVGILGIFTRTISGVQSEHRL